MTAEQIARCAQLRAAGVPWKVAAREIGVNVHTAKYHVLHKHNPSIIEARKRAWAKWAPKRRRPPLPAEAPVTPLGAPDLTNGCRGDPNPTGERHDEA